MVHVEVVYVDANNQCIQIPLTLEEPCTIEKALELSHIYTLHPETKELSFGIFSKPADLQTLVKDGARIEIYRPLTMDPKDKRRAKARALKKLK
jgi:putative ubiquitin-RnfH superfamily antitoxin RatB of RatAB toxin-antitoxin module